MQEVVKKCKYVESDKELKQKSKILRKKREKIIVNKVEKL